MSLQLNTLQENNSNGYTYARNYTTILSVYCNNFNIFPWINSLYIIIYLFIIHEEFIELPTHSTCGLSRGYIRVDHFDFTAKFYSYLSSKIFKRGT